MLAQLSSATLVGIDATVCEVEVDVAARGFHPPVVVGLPDPAVKESIERIRSALATLSLASGHSADSFWRASALFLASLRSRSYSFLLDGSERTR